MLLCPPWANACRRRSATSTYRRTVSAASKASDETDRGREGSIAEIPPGITSIVILAASRRLSGCLLSLIIDFHREPIEARPLAVACARAIAVPDVDSHVVVVAARDRKVAPVWRRVTSRPSAPQ